MRQAELHWGNVVNSNDCGCGKMIHRKLQEAISLLVIAKRVTRADTRCDGIVTTAKRDRGRWRRERRNDVCWYVVYAIVYVYDMDDQVVERITEDDGEVVKRPEQGPHG